MVIRGARASLARARMIRSARRSRSSKLFSRNTSNNNTSSKLNNSSKTQNTAQAKKIAMYEEIQKAADDLQQTAKLLLELGAEETNDSSGDEVTADIQSDEKTQEEQKKEIIAGVEDLVKQYNTIYEKLEKIGGSVNTLFSGQIKKMVENCAEELEKTGVSMHKDGTLYITEKDLESADLSTLKEVYCKSGGFVEKLSARCENIEANAASTIDIMNRMYGTQTYNKYGFGNGYFGNAGSSYNALG